MIRNSQLFLAFLLCASTVCVAEPCNVPASVDLTVNGITLYNIESQEKTLGKGIKFVDGKDTSPSTTFISSTGNEYLKLFTHYGGIGEVEEFEVSYSTDTKTSIPKLKQFKKFVSEKGIRLGFEYP